MSRFTDSLVVSPLTDGHTWVIFSPFGYDVGSEGSDDTINVDTGFMTDFASIPRIFWVVLPKWGKYGNAAVIHDWLYWTRKRSRLQADRIMLEAMKVLAVPAWQRFAIFHAVRWFGWAAWKRNEWDSKAGFERVVKVRRFESEWIPDRPGMFRRTWGRIQGRR